mmetsp:Transcript_52099/g.153757  ORF Transcript_52099/g.153757 Transcript_52099/m.153757 type:complete len:144 (+) Transcript_52099:247-678(+)
MRSTPSNSSAEAPTACRGRRYSYTRALAWSRASKRLRTRLPEKTRTSSGSAALIRASAEGESCHSGCGAGEFFCFPLCGGLDGALLGQVVEGGRVASLLKVLLFDHITRVCLEHHAGSCARRMNALVGARREGPLCSLERRKV